MDFSLTDERRMLAESLRGTLARGADWASLAALGVHGALFAEVEGGYGGGGFDIAVVFEEMGRAGATLPLLEAALAGGLLADCGEDGQVAGMIEGRLRPAFALDEPGSRYEPARIGLPGGVRLADRRLNGRKSVVAGAEGAGLLVVAVRTSGAPGDRGGITLVTVDPAAGGVSLHTTPALQGGMVSEVRFDNAPATPIGPVGGALPLIEARLAGAVLAVSADALGAMETVRAMTIDYLRSRRQFGKPIGSFQVLQHRMADVAIEIEQTRSAVINLAGHLHAAPALRDLHVSATKSLVGRNARLVAEEAIQMHGGIAMTEAYALAPLARRLIAVDHRFGDEDWHLERFIALGTPA